MGWIFTTQKKFNIELAKQTNRGALLILEAFKHDIKAKLYNASSSGVPMVPLRPGLEYILKEIDSAIETYTKSLEG
jgi:hypothetical protein